MSSAPASAPAPNAPTPNAAAPPPAEVTQSKTRDIGSLSILKDPRFLGGITVVCGIAFFITLISSLTTSKIDFNALDPSNLKVWWLGSILSSVVFLLLFFVVFRDSPLFNRAVIFLLLTTFVIIHVSLLLTQINLTV